MTYATILVTHFVVEELSNWYVRRNRRRFWKGDLSTDKLAAYQTLAECLLGVIKMMAPIAPFVSDALYRRLVKGQSLKDHPSIHVAAMIEPRKELIDADLERRMKIAQQVVFLVRSMAQNEYLHEVVPFLPWPIGAMPLCVSDSIFQFPTSIP